MDAVATIESEDQGRTFTVPESCIGNSKDARETTTTLLEAESVRSKKRAKVNGMWNGNPPWPGLLRAKGQGERANFTQRKFEGFVAAAKAPYYAMFSKPDRFIMVELEYGNADPGLLAEWCGRIATRYQYALKDWNGLDMHMQRSQLQMVVHGSGPMVWEDAEDWRSSSRMAGQILLPDDASAEIEDWDTAGCARSYLPTKLWNIVKNESAATARGWNVPAVKRAIMNAATESLQKMHGTTWEYYEAEMRKGATGYDAKSKRVFVADLFQREFSGKVSHFIVLREDEGKSPADTDKPDDPNFGFLFRKIGRFECFEQILCPFLYDVGPDGQWHSVKGAGPKLFAFYSVSDRLICRTMDGAMLQAGLVVKAKDIKALQQAAITPISGATVVGPDYEVMQQRSFQDLQSPLLANRVLDDTLSRNTGQYQAHFVTDDHAPTLGQEQMTAQQQNVLADGDADRYLNQANHFHKETFRRLLAMGKKLYAKRKDIAPVDIEEETSLTPSEKGALKFYVGCVKTDQIPEEVMEFENFCRIKAKRLVGNGSAQMQVMISEKLTALLPTMDERGRNFTLRNHVSALAGETMADAIYPAYDTPQVADSHMSLATLENNFLRLPNAQVMVDPSQDHVIHFGIHFQFVGQVGQQVQAGQTDPHELLILLEQAGPHTHEHLQAIAMDPTRKEQVEGMQKAWIGMSKMADQLAQQIQEMDEAAAAQQPQQAPDPALIKMIMEVQGMLDIKTKKMLGEMKLKKEKQDFAMKQKDAQTAQTMRLKNVSTMHAAKVADFEVATEVRRKNAETASNIRRKAAEPVGAAA